VSSLGIGAAAGAHWSGQGSAGRFGGADPLAAFPLWGAQKYPSPPLCTRAGTEVSLQRGRRTP